MSDPEGSRSPDSPDPSQNPNSPRPSPPPNSPFGSDFQNKPVENQPVGDPEGKQPANPETTPPNSRGGSDFAVASQPESDLEGNRPSDQGDSPGGSDFQNKPVENQPVGDPEGNQPANPEITPPNIPVVNEPVSNPEGSPPNSQGGSDFAVASQPESNPEGNRPADQGDSPGGSDLQNKPVEKQPVSDPEGNQPAKPETTPPNIPVVDEPVSSPEGSPPNSQGGSDFAVASQLEGDPEGNRPADQGDSPPLNSPGGSDSQIKPVVNQPASVPGDNRPATSETTPLNNPVVDQPASDTEDSLANLGPGPPPNSPRESDFENSLVASQPSSDPKGAAKPETSPSGSPVNLETSPTLSSPGHSNYQYIPIIHRRPASYPGGSRPPNRTCLFRAPGSPEFNRAHAPGYGRPHPDSRRYITSPNLGLLTPRPLPGPSRHSGIFGFAPRPTRYSIAPGPTSGPSRHSSAPKPTPGPSRYPTTSGPIPGSSRYPDSPHKPSHFKPIPKKESLKELKARKKKEMEGAPPDQIQEEQPLADPYANSTASNYITRGETGVVYDGEVLKHKCEWDERHPENPTRLACIIDKCYEKGFLSRCYNVANYLRTDLYEKILLVHTKEMFEKLKQICQMDDLANMEIEAAGYDSVYFNRHSFDAACRSLSSVLNLVFAVARCDVMNGMAFVRPPGHHAMRDEFNGYCFFNNVAIAAEACIREKIATKILIVDIDVHHGQGIQQHFYDRKDVLYFSIHRYEHGTFWPNLMESNFNYIGKGEGVGYNVNVPLNATGLTDEDYLAIVFSLLLPIGYEFNPDLIIVSAGYDAAMGCPEGKMNVTPGFYSHLITLLSGLARGQIAVCLEGGYFPPTLSESATMTLKALLGGPCPPLGPIRSVNPSVIDSICNVRRTLFNLWKCFSFCETIPPSDAPARADEHHYKIAYYGKSESAPFLTRRCYPENTEHENIFYARLNKALREKYRAPMNLPVHYVYDEKMMLHAPKTGDVERPERGERLTCIFNVFKEYGIDKRAHKIEINKRDFTPYNPHDPVYFKAINENLQQSKDVYVNEFTRDCVMNAASGLLTLADSIMSGAAGSGVAVVRPPGHHAEHDKAMGFCFANNVAIAANYLHQKYRKNRILIVDFDVHHGNGTQNMFYQDKHVMYISIHRHDDGKYFPPNPHRNYTHDGQGIGQGYNINIPFNKDKMGDAEYIAVFHNIILPAAYSYDPEIVIVSAGFDAGIHDPLGGYNVNPETFGHFIQMLKPLAEGKMILALEGGYNLTTTGYAMGICTKVLLGDPVMMPKNFYETFSREAAKTIRKVTEHFKKYYNIFKVNKKLAITPVMHRKLNNFTEDSHNVELYRMLDIDKVEDSEYVEEQLRMFNSAREH